MSAYKSSKKTRDWRAKIWPHGRARGSVGRVLQSLNDAHGAR